MGYGSSTTTIQSWTILSNNTQFKILTSRERDGSCYPLTNSFFLTGNGEISFNSIYSKARIKKWSHPGELFRLMSSRIDQVSLIMLVYATDRHNTWRNCVNKGCIVWIYSRKKSSLREEWCRIIAQPLPSDVISLSRVFIVYIFGMSGEGVLWLILPFKLVSY